MFEDPIISTGETTGAELLNILQSLASFVGLDSLMSNMGSDNTITTSEFEQKLNQIYDAAINEGSGKINSLLNQISALNLKTFSPTVRNVMNKYVSNLKKEYDRVSKTTASLESAKAIASQKNLEAQNMDTGRKITGAARRKQEQALTDSKNFVESISKGVEKRLS